MLLLKSKTIFRVSKAVFRDCHPINKPSPASDSIFVSNSDSGVHPMSVNTKLQVSYCFKQYCINHLFLFG